MTVANKNIIKPIKLQEKRTKVSYNDVTEYYFNR